MSVQVHSDGPGGLITITLTKTGSAEGHIAIAGAASENFDVFDVAADPAALRLTCKSSILFTEAQVDIKVTTGEGGGLPSADINVTNALIGTINKHYPIRNGEDAKLRTFLTAAQFPRL